jgi:hypothetical protein
MQIGQPHDKRKYRRLKSTDYYVAKAAVEAGEITEWPRCEICGLECKGKTFSGSKDGQFLCVECWNETV